MGGDRSQGLTGVSRSCGLNWKRIGVVELYMQTPTADTVSLGYMVGLSRSLESTQGGVAPPAEKQKC